MSEDRVQTSIHGGGRALPRLNARPFLIAALGLLCGCCVYGAAAFRSGSLAGAAVFAMALFFLLFPFRLRRIVCVVSIFLPCALAAAGGMHLSAMRFLSGAAAGEHAVTGTVEMAAVRDGYIRATLTQLFIDGAPEDGKMEITVSGEEVRVGDILTFTCEVARNALPSGGDGYAESDFAADLRYAAAPSEYSFAGKTRNVFLLLNGALYDLLHNDMERDTANISYALLTGNMGVMDYDFAEATRTGGIAHVFAVSGMHISVLYAAVMLLLRRPMGRWATIPALLLGAAYCAMCAFTVSSVRSLLMCGFAGGMRFFGKKYDDLSSLSLSAALTLLVSPSQYFSIGFRLSYGGMAGIFLFAEPLSRGLRRVKVPDLIAADLVSGIAAQIFTMPMMLATFGYLPAWGMLLNLIVIPAMPVLFLPLVACAFLALVLPFAAGVLLAFPEGLLFAVLLVFSYADVSAVLAGFSLGAGAGVWYVLNVPLSARVRLRPLVRAAACSLLAALFCACVVMENAVFGGCRVDVTYTERGSCALVRTRGHAVLLIDGRASLSLCTDFLRRTCMGQPDAVAVLSQDEVRAINVAVFLPADAVYAAYPAETGLREHNVVYAESFAVGEMYFRYEDADRLMLLSHGCAAEFCFEGEEALGADFFVGKGAGRLKYLLKDGIIKEL